MSFQHFRESFLTLSLCLVAVLTASNARGAEILLSKLGISTDFNYTNPSAADFSTEGITAFFDRFGNPVFQVDEKYYSQFTYSYKDKAGVTHTASITEPATSTPQIIALLRKIYTDPRIPGFVSDVAYNPENPNFSKLGYENEYQTISISGITDLKSLEDNPLKDDDDLKKRTKVTPRREDYYKVEYGARDFYPYNIKSDEVSTPINGGTALVVELADNYAFDNDASDVCGSYNKNTPYEEIVDNAFGFIKAVRIMPKQQYIRWGENANGEIVESGGSTNPGFLFNIDAQLSKCFLITKGCNRPYKEYEFRFYHNYDRPGKDYIAGMPFFSMFEEFSPHNKGPKENAFVEMDKGVAFTVNHNCSSSMQQQHDIVFAPSRNDTYSYNVNLMFALPELRFDHVSTTMPGTTESYSPYSYYAPDHLPYIFFNKIQAEIGTPVTALPTFEDGDIPTPWNLDEESPLDIDNTTAYAYVPLKWKSHYNRIVGRQADESFRIHRVTNGETDELPILFEDITLVPDGDKSRLEPSGSPYHIISHADSIYAYVREPLKVTENGELVVDRIGNEVSYKILGRRSGNNDFIDVHSNIVVGYLPGNDIQARLTQAASKSDIEAHRNIYSNRIDLIYNGYDSSTGTFDLKSQGNITFSDVISSRIEDLFNDDKVVDNLSFREDIEIHAYRINVTTGRRTLLARFLPKELRHDSQELEKEDGDGKSAYVKTWGTDDLYFSPEKSVVVVELDGYYYHYNDDGSLDKVEFSQNAFKAKADPLTLDKGITNLRPLDGEQDMYAHIVDNFNSVAQEVGINNRFRYYFCIVRDDNGTVMDHNSAVSREYSLVKLSNYANVYVPLREIFTGFVPYSHQEILADTDGSLPANGYGIAVNVLNNEHVAGYEIFEHDPDKGSPVPFARIDRNVDGHFVSSVYDPEGNDVVTWDGESYRVRKQHVTPPNYSGKVFIKLPSDFEHNDKSHFSAVIRYYNSSVYSGNTYVMPSVELPVAPSIRLFSVEPKYQDQGPDGRYRYDCETSVEATLPPDYTVYNYGFWTTEIGTDFTEKVNHYHPSMSSPKNRANVLGASSASDDEGFSTDFFQKKYIMTHSQQAATASQFINFTKYARLYATVPEDRIISADFDSSLPAYIVADTNRDYSTNGFGYLSGIEDIEMDDFDSDFILFNLQGIRVNPQNATPGIYILSNGSESRKIRIQ